jgi:uncharacterized protein YbjT (DUF2867 family)
MKYVITGGAGHTAAPIAKGLLAAGHEVAVIGRQAQNLESLAAAGAQAATGSLEDPAFLAQTFQGADVVYAMIPQNFAVEDYAAWQREIAENLIQAIREAGVTKLVFLSSVGAHLKQGAGPVDGLAYFERRLAEELPSVDAVHLRPSYFYYNLFSQIPLIKGMNIMGGNYGGANETLALTHTDDIADVALIHLLHPQFTGQQVVYIASDEKPIQEMAATLAEAIGKPGIPWVEFPDEQALGGMLQSGLKQGLAQAYLQLGKALRDGTMQEDYFKNRPALGKIKLHDFSKEFAAAFHANATTGA